MPDQFDEWLDSGLSFTIRGEEFRVEPPSALTILNLHRRLISGEPVNDATEREDICAVLGPTWAKMRDANVPDFMAMHVGRAAVTKYLDSADNAIAVWRFEAPHEPAAPARRQPSIKGIAPDDAVDPPGTINDYDPGGGPYIPEKGIRVWAYPMEYAPAARPGYVPESERVERAGWPDIFDAWDAIEIDFELLCRRDLTPELLDVKPWRWFAVRLSRILGDRDTWSSQLISSRKAVDDDGDSAG